MRAIIVAGATSGVGKTTVATGLMGALCRRGLKVQPFKAGPDYIDTSYHTWVTGSPSRNIDTWMLPREAVIELFERAVAGKDIAVIEGVMGLYDGRSSTNDEASTAEVAKLLGAPVLLVVDSRKGARSLAAMVGGYRDFDPALKLVGVILNGISSEMHLDLCRDAIEHYTGVKVVGHLPWHGGLSLPERHLGLVPAVEEPAGEDFRRELIAQCEATFDIPEILRLAAQAVVPHVESELFPAERRTPVAKIAVARDKAFSFYYQDSLDLLEAWGAELVPFSPIDDQELHRGVSGIYIGGGFPEVFAGELAENSSMKEAIKRAASSGMPIYAECGGLMYLGTSIIDFDGKEHVMTGILPVVSRIDKRKLSLAYRTVEAIADGPLLRKGETARGHEFHWSNLEGPIGPHSAYRVLGSDTLEGLQTGSVLASYVHIHMGSRPSLAPRFVNVCVEFAHRVA